MERGASVAYTAIPRSLLQNAHRHEFDPVVIPGRFLELTVGEAHCKLEHDGCEYPGRRNRPASPIRVETRGVLVFDMGVHPLADLPVDRVARDVLAPIHEYGHNGLTFVPGEQSVSAFLAISHSISRILLLALHYKDKTARLATSSGPKLQQLLTDLSPWVKRAAM